MRKFGAGLMVMLLVAGVALAGGSKTILVLSTPNVDTALADRVFKFMQKNVRGDMLYQKTLFKVADFGPEEQLRVFSAMRGENSPVVVALVSDTDSKFSPVIYSTKRGAAVVNVGLLMHKGQLTEKQKNALVDRSVMYALGRVVGGDACPNPYCALSEYKVLKNNVIGRNYCPVCTDKVTEKLSALGIKEQSLRKAAR